MTNLIRSPGFLVLTIVGLASVPTTSRAWAQDDPLGLGPRDVVAARAVLMPGSAVVPGGLVSIRIELSFRPGWHVYANPAGIEMFRPTVAELVRGAPATLVHVDYPAGTPQSLDDGSGQVARIYDRPTVLLVRVRLADSVRPGPLTMPLEVRHQACNANACLPPKALRVPLVLTVKPAAG